MRTDWMSERARTMHGGVMEGSPAIEVSRVDIDRLLQQHSYNVCATFFDCIGEYRLENSAIFGVHCLLLFSRGRQVNYPCTILELVLIIVNKLHLNSQTKAVSFSFDSLFFDLSLSIVLLYLLTIISAIVSLKFTKQQCRAVSPLLRSG